MDVIRSSSKFPFFKLSISPKSSIFINGILDNLVKEFQADNKLLKTGRGLM